MPGFMIAERRFREPPAISSELIGFLSLATGGRRSRIVRQWARECRTVGSVQRKEDTTMKSLPS
nr:hypothetical protein Iba_chr08aCG11840 [Ipomoea batatas]GMD24013.1 hypothetical protein Iba_chr08bCG10750 [Ipomoea batatas]GME11848.1 hypothetical protein Iba_scaffold12713CG0020 [Ipomoea batatas]